MSSRNSNKVNFLFQFFKLDPKTKIEAPLVVKKGVRDKIRHYRQIYLNRPDPITFMSLALDTSDRVYDDFNRLLFLCAHREASTLAKELPRNRINFVFFAVLV